MRQRTTTGHRAPALPPAVAREVVAQDSQRRADKREGGKPKRAGAARDAAQAWDARRLRQYAVQRQLQKANANPFQGDGGRALPEKQQQTHHNPVTDAMPFGLLTADQ